MARIAGVDLPREKRIEIGLTYVYGIGRATATKLCAEAGVDPDTRVRNITDDEVKKITEAIETLGIIVEGDLRREVALNIKRLQEIGCYRGIRHRKGLPVRGQNTKNNARTRKGPKRTGTCPAKSISFTVSQSNNCIVKRRLNMCLSAFNVFLYALFSHLFGACFCHI